jgi:RND family efflux transporter MFP subunit
MQHTDHLLPSCEARKPSSRRRLAASLACFGALGLAGAAARAQASPPAAPPKAPPTVIQGTLERPGAAARQAPAKPAAPTIGCLISPTRIADIGSPVTGIVERITVDVGDSVRQGQTLVTLRSEVESAGERAAHARWSVDAEVRASEASLELARQRWQRARDLQAQGFFSPQAVEQALTELKLAEQKLKQTVSQREVLATDLEVVRAQVGQRVVRAPFSGTIVERFRQPGERVEDRPLLRLASLDPLRVDLLVPASRFGQYAVGDRLQLQPELASVKPVTAEVTHVDRVIDGASNTFRVRLSLPNPQQRLPAGARCTVDDAAVAAAAPTRPAPAPGAGPSAAPGPSALPGPSAAPAAAPTPARTDPGARAGAPPAGRVAQAGAGG